MPVARRRVDDGRRPDLGHPVLARVDVEEPVDEAALERRPGALVDREARAGDLGAAGVVDDVELIAELPVRSAGPGRATRGGIGADLADERLVVGQLLAPHPDGDVRLLATDRDVGVGRVRDAQEQVVEVRLGVRERRVELGDAHAGRGGGGAQVGDLGAVGRGTALDRLADPLRGRVAFGLERLVLGQEPAPFRVELDGAVDQRRVLALADGAVADRVGVLAETLESDAHAGPPIVAGVASAASRSRRTTKSWSSDASSQPARGPLSRPRNAR